MPLDRRAFLRLLALAGPGLAARLHAQNHGESSVMAALRAGQATEVLRPGRTAGLPQVDLAAAGEALRRRFRDLRRHFIFEYYPWYRTDPWFHWDEGGRTPPVDLATNYVPLAGAYDSRDRAVVERHARWMAETGAGAINLSWWGSGSYEDGTIGSISGVSAVHGTGVLRPPARPLTQLGLAPP